MRGVVLLLSVRDDAHPDPRRVPSPRRNLAAEEEELADEEEEENFIGGEAE